MNFVVSYHSRLINQNKFHNQHGRGAGLYRFWTGSTPSCLPTNKKDWFLAAYGGGCVFCKTTSSLRLYLCQDLTEDNRILSLFYNSTGVKDKKPLDLGTYGTFSLVVVKLIFCWIALCHFNTFILIRSLLNVSTFYLILWFFGFSSIRIVFWFVFGIVICLELNQSETLIITVTNQVCSHLSHPWYLQFWGDFQKPNVGIHFLTSLEQIGM